MRAGLRIPPMRNQAHEGRMLRPTGKLCIGGSRKSVIIHHFAIKLCVPLGVQAFRWRHTCQCKFVLATKTSQAAPRNQSTNSGQLWRAALFSSA